MTSVTLCCISHCWPRGTMGGKAESLGRRLLGSALATKGAGWGVGRTPPVLPLPALRLLPPAQVRRCWLHEAATGLARCIAQLGTAGGASRRCYPRREGPPIHTPTSAVSLVPSLQPSAQPPTRRLAHSSLTHLSVPLLFTGLPIPGSIPPCIHPSATQQATHGQLSLPIPSPQATPDHRWLTTPGASVI